MSKSNLELAVRTLPSFVPRRTQLPSYGHIITALHELHKKYPQYVNPPQQLLLTPEGEWIYHFTLGHGDHHTVIDAIAHSGEPLWAAASLRYGLGLCKHPELLDGRTVHFLYGDPVGLLWNLEQWAIRKDLVGTRDDKYLYESIINHWRHPVLVKNDCWSFPFQCGEEWVNEPTPGAQASMMVMDEIIESGGQLELWVAGHNRLIGNGVQFLLTGSDDEATAKDLEWFAERVRIPLDPAPVDNPNTQLHPGCVASWSYDTAADLRAFYPELRVGGTAYDYGVKRFPKMSIQATEVGMFRARRIVPWRGVTWEEANRRAVEITTWLRGDLDKISEIAARLEEKGVTDRFISATAGINQAPVPWGTMRDDPREPGEVLSPSEAFQIMCADTLYLARMGGPALAMIDRHGEALREITGERPEYLSGMLHQAMTLVIWWWAHQLKRQPLAPALTLQIAAAEISAYGSRGTHLTP
jgi:hypothetical protein